MKTIKMKKVLIALDYDPTAQKVAELGYSLAKSMKAEVTLLHVMVDLVHYTTTDHITIMGFAGYMDTSQTELKNEEEMKKVSQKFLDKMQHHLGDDSIKTIVREGNFAETILSSAKEEKADLIVLGTHSRKWLESIILGSVAEKVLHLSTIPLFIIPTKKQS